MRSYEAARSTFNRMETFANIITLIGIVVALIGGFSGGTVLSNAMPGFLAFVICALPGFFVAMYGSSSLVNAQMGRASVDSAEYAQLSLGVARQQLELSQEALALSKSQHHTSYAAKLATVATAAAQTEPATTTDSDQGPSYADRAEVERPSEAEVLPAKDPSPQQDTVDAIEADGAITLEAKADVPVPNLEAPGMPEHTSVVSQPVVCHEPLSSGREVDLTQEDIASSGFDVNVADAVTKTGNNARAALPESTLVPQERKSLDKEATPDEEADARISELVSGPKPKKEIVEVDGRYQYGTMSFKTREAAERYVGQFGVNSNAQLSSQSGDTRASRDGTTPAASHTSIKGHTDIVYRDGHFVVGDKAFKTKRLALEYRHQLQFRKTKNDPHT